MDELPGMNKEMPVLGVYDMVCKFCRFRITDESEEFHFQQGDAYRGAVCGKLNPKPIPVMNGEKCRKFKADREAQSRVDVLRADARVFRHNQPDAQPVA